MVDGITRPLYAAFLVAVVGGCTTTKTSAPAGDLIEQTAVGKARCKEAAEQQLRPFVVEWDATDLAGFEAHAARDVVLVKYEGCHLEVLDGCVDGDLPGRYGKYDAPQFTSGTKEQVDINNEDELYAELPLGVAAFGGRVKHGEALHLEYFVTGVAKATVFDLTADQLSNNPRCSEATHFVSQYHLGAFELGANEKTEGGAEVGVETLGAEAGGQSKRAATELKQGGDLASCDTQTQTRCRVPIRVVLTPLGAGHATDEGLATPASTPAPAPASAHGGEKTPKEQAYLFRNSARQKMDKKDGRGCLEAMERANRLDPHGEQDNVGLLQTRSWCMMIAGDCEGGKKLYGEMLRATDKDKKLDEETIERYVSATANGLCPSNTGSKEERFTRAYSAMVNAMRQNPPNATLCLDEIKRAEPEMKPRTRETPDGENFPALLQTAALCLGKAGRCEEAKKLWVRYFELNYPTESNPHAAAEATFSGVKGCSGR